LSGLSSYQQCRYSFKRSALQLVMTSRYLSG
jgi:hypothetical protein